MTRYEISNRTIVAYVLVVIFALGIATLGFTARSKSVSDESTNREENQLNQDLLDSVDELDRAERKLNALRSARNLRAFRDHAKQLRAENRSR